MNFLKTRRYMVKKSKKEVVSHHQLLSNLYPPLFVDQGRWGVGFDTNLGSMTQTDYFKSKNFLSTLLKFTFTLFVKIGNISIR